MNISDSSFINNSAGNNSGAIENGANLNIFKSNFTNNTAIIYGGAIYSVNHTLVVYNSNFLDNYALNGNGNAICTYVNSSLEAKYNVFIDNNHNSKQEVFVNLRYPVKVSLDYNWWGQDTSNYNKSPTELKLTNYHGDRFTRGLYYNASIEGNLTVDTPTNISITLNGFYNSNTRNISRIRASLLSQTIPITFKTINGTVTPLAANITRGNITIHYTPTSTVNSITNTYANITNNFTNTKIINSVVKINQVTGIIGNRITLNANIKEVNGNNLTGGKVVFKINGVTLKNSKGAIIYILVKNGIAQLNYRAQNSWSNKNSKIEVVYNGVKNRYNQSRSTNKITILKRTAELNLTIDKNITKAADIVQVKTTVKDNGKLINTGNVIFKLNGNTIKDNKGHTVVVPVKNGSVIYNYTIPTGMSAHTYNLTAIYLNKAYNRATTNIPLSITKIDTNLILNQSTTIRGSNTTQITGIIKDINGNPVIRNMEIAVKLSGKTITHKNIINGLINLNITIPNTLKGNNYTITVVTGTNSAYIGTTLNTTLVIKPKHV